MAGIGGGGAFQSGEDNKVRLGRRNGTQEEMAGRGEDERDRGRRDDVRPEGRGRGQVGKLVLFYS